ncbi:MAG: protein kinase [Bryobacteraceae bacterium]
MSSQRYVIRQILGRGGMGAVYRAWDEETRREVTLKTLLDVQDRTMLDLFYKECRVLASLNHPNIVDIYDVGEMDIEGGRKPYFVMPLLHGVTLDRLIAEHSHRLSVERVVDIMAQACRGLHAAHERGLVHRDIKPSNIFVMDDDSVKIIDFGVAHLSDSRTATTLKGTLHYMAPEQVQMQKPTALSDLFSLGVVAYQTLTRRRPFEGTSMDEVVQAILNRVPPPVSDYNPVVNRAISQVIHKAMAKQPWHRFASAREFGDNMQRAQRGEPIDAFDETKITPRLQRARKAVEAGELDFANEVLGGLEAEGFLHPEMMPLRRQLDQTLKTRTVRQLHESARRFLDEDEYQLALQKVQELIQVDPHNTSALALKAEIEGKRSTEQVTKWLKLAQQHLDQHAYGHARQAVESVLEIKPEDTSAKKLLNEIDQKEQDYVRLRKKKEEVYQAAVKAWERGDVSIALADMEQVIDLEAKAPETASPEKAALYQQFFNKVRSEADELKTAYETSRRLVAEHNLSEALGICGEYLKRFPSHALFQALKVDIEEQQRHELSAYIARIDREVEDEPDLDRRVSILREALSARPKEPHFERSLQLITAKRELVESIVSRARGFEEKGQYQEAGGQWEMLRTIYPMYPGLDIEIDRVVKRQHARSRDEAKARWAGQIDRALGARDWQRARDLATSALGEFPNDGELSALDDLARQGLERAEAGRQLMAEGRQQCESGELDNGIETLRRAFAMNDHSVTVRGALVDALLRRVRSVQETEPAKAEDSIQEILDLEPSNVAAMSLRTLIQDRRKADYVEQVVAKARQHQAAGSLEHALTAVGQGLAAYPMEARLTQLRDSLERSRTETQRGIMRRNDLDQLRRLERQADAASPEERKNLFEQTVTIGNRHLGDSDFDSVLAAVRQKLKDVKQPEPSRPSLPKQTVEAKPVTPVPPKPVIPASKQTPARLPVPEPPSSPPPAAEPSQAPVLPVTPLPPPAPPPPGLRSPARKEPPPAPRTGKPARAPKGVLIAAGVAVLALIGGALAWRALRVAPAPITPPPVAEPGVPPPATPAAATVRVHTDLTEAAVTLDSVDRGPVPGGQGFDLAELLDGDHLLKVNAREGAVELVFRSAAGQAPEFSNPTVPPTLTAVVVAAGGGKGRVFSSKAPARISFDGGSAFQNVPAEGVALEAMPEGMRDVVIEIDGKRRTESLQVDAAPGISLLLYSNRAPVSKGQVVISANEGGFEVLLDGRPVSYRQRGGDYVVANLDVGRRKITIRKPGFTVEPETSTVEIRENQAAPLTVKLTGIPVRLSIRGGTPGAQVVLMPAQRVIGATDAQGNFTTTELAAGEHLLEFRKRGYRSRQTPVTLSTSSETTLSGNDVAIAMATAVVYINKVEPKSGNVAVVVEQSKGVLPYQGPVRFPDVPAKVVVPEGFYNFTFSANGYESSTISAQLEGKLTEIKLDVRLTKK